ncbi:ABC transporter permease [Streptomyces pinistramenti]|uniref:ABC transporter permease n=1 Tax=Streptomyces pinistramenti TaxID=2884812 RepID=UPI001D0845DA|nr:ABC transporter permease [Streptomyces pinistramenti]MCB5909368.1 ABC transporter permease [Streptomyces pinistramenti]
MSPVRRSDRHRDHGLDHRPDRRSPHTAGLRHVLLHLVTPLLMCIGMGLAYLGAFADPAPHHLPVAVVGSGQSAQLLAQSINDKAGGDLEARTVPDRATATEQLRHQDIFGAYVPHGKSGTTASGTHGTDSARSAKAAGTTGPAPELMVATAGSDTSASVVQKVFTPIAAQQGRPLKVTDVAPTAQHDPTGQGIFFLLVAISIGSYASVAVIGGAGAVLPMRLRALLAVGTSFVVSIIGTLFAGPVFHLVDHGMWGLWSMAWLYSAGILLIGTGLHTFLKRWTTLGVMALFVMLNFTSSGGIFRPEMQNGFFAALHSFWNGAGFVEGTRSHVYFNGYGLAGHVGTLVIWLVIGAASAGIAGLAESRRKAAEKAAAERATAVAAAAVAATVTDGGRHPEQAARADGRRRGCDAESGAEAEEEEMEEAVGV